MNVGRSKETQMRVAVLGLGAMGAAIARRLEAADVELAVYNRSPAPAQEFEARGVRVGSTPQDAAAGADIAISMLADGPAVEAVLLGDGGALAAEAAPPGTVIDMSTIDVAASERIAARARDLGVAYLRAPVSGNPGVVAAGNLTILVSGDEQAFETARQVLSAIGPTLFHLGDGEEARVMKLALNLMVGGTTQLLAEALVMGEAHGLARDRILEVIGASAVGSPLVKYKSGPLVAEDYTSTFSARLMHKDLRLVVECANGAGVPVPVTAIVQQLIQACVGSGMGELDFAVLVPRLQREAGQATSLPAA
jgi:3-hydroxyisobutyrate dehydrogenase-like beta-hydroxyacid dehydrogenase